MVHLAQRGFRFTYVPFESPRLHEVIHEPGHYVEKALGVCRGLAGRLRGLAAVKRFDLVFVYREAAPIGPPIIEWMTRRLGVPIIFDFDDAIFLGAVSEFNRPLGYLKWPGKTATICRLSTHVIVGNAYLREYAAQYSPRVSVVPTTIDTDHYQERPAQMRAGREEVVIGWIGSPTTAKYVRSIHEALRRLRARHRFTLRLIGAPPETFDGLEAQVRPWRAATEVQDIQSFDIGLMPLPDDRWTRGKCGFKALQYMAVGTPVVCSPVGVNTEIVEHGVNGFLARDLEEWVEHLSRLLDDPALRQRMGRAGRQTVEARYSTERYVPQVVEIFRSAISASRRASLPVAAPPSSAVTQAMGVGR